LNQRHLLYIVLALLLAGAGWYYRTGRDGRRIHRRLDQLAGLVEKEAGQSPLRTIGKARGIGDYFTSDAVVQLYPILPDPIRQADLAPVLHYVHNQADRLTVRISDRHLEIDRAHGTAHLRLTARGTVHAGASSHSLAHEFALDWIKRDREWYIQKADVVQAIRAPHAHPAPDGP
jgi:hypothetical protein